MPPIIHVHLHPLPLCRDHVVLNDQLQSKDDLDQDLSQLGLDELFPYLIFYTHKSEDDWTLLPKAQHKLLQIPI